MQTETSTKMNILQVLVKLRDDIKDWVQQRLNEKQNKSFSGVYSNRVVITDDSGNIITAEGSKVVTLIGAAPAHIASTEDISVGQTLPSGTLYVVYEE